MGKDKGSGPAKKGGGKSNGSGGGKGGQQQNSGKTATLQAKRDHLAQTEALYGSDNELVAQLRQAVEQEEAREQQQAAAQPTSTLAPLVRVQRQLQCATVALDKRRAAVAQAEEAMVQARKNLEEAKAALATAEWKVDELTSQAQAASAAAAPALTAASHRDTFEFRATRAQVQALKEEYGEAVSTAALEAQVEKWQATMEASEKQRRLAKVEIPATSNSALGPVAEVAEVEDSEDDYTDMEDVETEGALEGDGDQEEPFQTVKPRRRKTSTGPVGGVQKKTKGAPRG